MRYEIHVFEPQRHMSHVTCHMNLNNNVRVMSHLQNSFPSSNVPIDEPTGKSRLLFAGRFLQRDGIILYSSSISTGISIHQRRTLLGTSNLRQLLLTFAVLYYC